MARVAGLAMMAVLLAWPAASSGAATLRPPSGAWILVDASSGNRLAGKEADRPRAIASATKLMTAYLSLHRLPLGRRLAAPTYRASPAESKIDLRPGERMSVRDLLQALLLESANDAAAALARGVAGSTPRFVREMNLEAKRLGLDETHYSNPVGLDQVGNYSSPRDLAELTRRLQANAVFRRIVDSPSGVLRTGARTRRIVNRNRLVRTVPWIDGVKTGHTRDAGWVLIGSGARQGLGLISVVLDAPSEPARESATLALLNYGFSRYRRLTPLRRGVPLARVPVRYSDRRLPLAPLRTASLAVPRGRTLETRVEAPEDVEGPIDPGRRIGRAIVTLGGRVVARVPLAATAHVPAPGFADRLREGVQTPLVLLVLGSVLALAGILLARRRALARRHQMSI